VHEPALAQALSGVLDRLDAAPRPAAVRAGTPAAVLVALDCPLSAGGPMPGGPSAGAAHGAGAAREARGRDAGGLLAARALFIVRRPDLRRHAGEIAFPGGRWDEGDGSLLETALRESREEIGIDAAHVTPLGALTPVSTIATGYTVYPFVGLLGPAAKPAAGWRLSTTEVERVLELPLGQVRAARGRTRLVRRGITFETDSYTVDGNVIWGATARIVEDLLRRIDRLPRQWAGRTGS
jgi:8-oxo-dGTP pyrophosphatase MutT (NUDIX family)